MTRTLVPWSTRFPSVFDDFRREMADMMERSFVREADNGGLPGFSPRMNVAEREDAWEVTLDLPGVEPEDFHVELDKNDLWITGERKSETEEEGKAFHRVERLYGSFRRALTLPSAVDGDRIAAEYKDGVLRITVPKAEAARPKRIPVSV